MKKYSLLIWVVTIALFSACSKDSLEPTLADDVLAGEILDENQMRQFVDGSYNIMANYRYWGRNVIIAGEVRADNVFANNNSGRFITMGANNLTERTGDVTDIFQYAYGSLANANIVIATNPENVTSEDPGYVDHMMGEAYAIRALIHFDLLRMFGQQHVAGQGGLGSLGVSYMFQFQGEELYAPRSTVEETRDFIYQDLDAAAALMDAQYNDGNKVSITTFAVNAIKSRVATYFRQYDIARAACEEVIGNFTITPEDNVVASWSSSEVPAASIFELAQNDIDNNGNNSVANIYRGPSYGDIQVLDNFVENAEFGPDDVRASADMIGVADGGVRNLGKYPSMGVFSDNIKIIRYEEVVLNYAEALVETNPALALTHLNSIPLNRGGTVYAAATYENILKERRKELAFEGFRFDDLARFNMDIPVIDAISQTHGGPAYGSDNYAMPIPIQERNNNPFTDQNKGY